MAEFFKKRTLRFNAIDTLFFRESRPMDATGELQSVFPPPIRTLVGAVRHWIGRQEQVDWTAFKRDPNHQLRELMGDPHQEDDLGQLRFSGAWLSYKKQRLYPVPLNLMRKKREGNQKGNGEKAYQLFQLSLSEQGYYCDLGQCVRLAELPSEAALGSQPLNNIWMTKQALSQWLRGEIPSYNSRNFFTSEQLFERESRIGIARDNQRGTVIDGLLYQTQHIRPKADTAIEIDVSGLKRHYPLDNMLRLGGEGRSVHMTIHPPQTRLSNVNNQKIVDRSRGIILYLLTPLLIKQTSEKHTEAILPSHQNLHVLPEFKRCEPDKTDNAQTTYWKGAIKGIELKLYGAIVGKVLREGGWDLANHCPRPVKSLLPAGSLFYCEVVDNDINKAINTLSDIQLGQLQNYGYGQMTVGVWT